MRAVRPLFSGDLAQFGRLRRLVGGARLITGGEDEDDVGIRTAEIILIPRAR